MALEKQFTVGGLRAIDIYYRPIRSISTGSTAFYQAQTRLNTPNLGVIMPETFRDVSEITNQCIDLFRLELVQVLEAAKKFKERELNFEWVALYMPIKFLKDAHAEKSVMEYFSKFEVPTNKLCFMLSESLLEETDGVAAKTIEHLRNRGHHFMLTGFGGNNCPMMRLADFPVDYVMLSPEVAQYIGRGERSDGAVKSIIGFVNDMGAEPIADGVVNSHQAETLFTFECAYCAGNLTGKYVAERYVRIRKDDDQPEDQS